MKPFRPKQGMFLDEETEIMKDAPAWKIVLIDDEEDIRDVVSIVLEDAGFAVVTARDGETGLALCRAENPQIVLTDIRMPGVDGIQVLQTLKQTCPEVEVIVVTAFGDVAIAVRALQLDASDFITKPIDEDALLVALDRAKKRYASRKALMDYTGFLEAENVKTSEELVRIHAFQKNLIEHSMDGILACDGEGIVRVFNSRMETLLEYSKAEAVGRLCFDGFFAPDAQKTLMASLDGPGFGGENRLFLYETELKARSGREIPVQVSATVLWEGSVKAGLVCFFRDLRQIRKLEREISDQASILHQDKMMALGRLSASVVHEINNPLFGVLNYLRLMIRIMDRESIDAAGAAKFRRYLDLVEKEIQRCSTIISSLLAFSRKSEPSFGDVDVAALLDRCVLLSRHKLELSGIELKTRIDSDLPIIRGDAGQLQQCLINLIFNAVDAMPDGGTLTLACSVDPAACKVEMEVADTGCGIEEQHLPVIFEPFFTTKKEGQGVGLGLSTVAGIVEHHRGTISAESRPGCTVFRIALPAGSEQTP